MADTRDVQVGAALRHVTDGLASLIFTTTVLILPDGLFPGRSSRTSARPAVVGAELPDTVLRATPASLVKSPMSARHPVGGGPTAVGK